MKNITTKLLLLIGFAIAFFACNGQTKPGPLPKSNIKTIGKVVPRLGKNAMIVFQDSKDNYWFGSRDEGVFYYNGKHFIQYTEQDGLFRNGIRSIQEDQLGNIYFDTGEGVNKFDGQTIEKLVLSKSPINEWKLSPNDLWFEGHLNQNGVLRYDGEQLFHLTLPKHALEFEFYSQAPNATYSPYDVYKTFKDSKGNIWIGTATFGACRFDGESFTWVSEREMTEIDPGPAPGVRSILEDTAGYFWFSSNVNHKYRLLPDNESAEQEGLKYQKSAGIDTFEEPGLNPYFMSIAQDDRGDFWLATHEDGVWRYDGKVFIPYPIKDGDKIVQIFSIYKDNDGVLWLGTHNAGALKYNGKTFEKFEPTLK